MAKTRRLDLSAIRACLLETQQNFKKINASLRVKRHPPSDEVIDNLVAGYAKVDEYISQGVDLLAYGNSHLLLELNHIVLYETAMICEQEESDQYEATRDYFYDPETGGIDQFMEWLHLHNHDTVWKQAAGVFTCILSQPQLFMEGNHRTGSLIMSYLLMRAGRAPFVLSYDNARHFFEPAELTKKRRKKNLVDDLIHLPKQTRKFAKLLKNEQDSMQRLFKT